jgi:hypothetical protein
MIKKYKYTLGVHEKDCDCVLLTRWFADYLQEAEKIEPYNIDLHMKIVEFEIETHRGQNFVNVLWPRHYKERMARSE